MVMLQRSESRSDEKDNHTDCSGGGADGAGDLGQQRTNETERAEDLTVICAWCKGVIKEGTSDSHPVSHGMCGDCRAGFCTG